MNEIINLTSENFDEQVLRSSTPVLVDVDEEPRLAAIAGVQGIPFVALYADGEISANAVGAQAKPALESALGLDRLPA